MPSVTFLVSVSVPEASPESLLMDAEEIHDILSTSFDVESVAPWARPTLPTAAPAGGFTSLNGQPPAQQPPL